MRRVKAKLDGRKPRYEHFLVGCCWWGARERRLVVVVVVVVVGSGVVEALTAR